MILELINTGSELMLGRVLNTHQQWICRQLADHGYTVSRQVAVPDTAIAIEQAVRDALHRADAILTTGGLGPTSDDLTREHIARLLGRALHPHAETLDRIRRFYEARRRPLPAGVELQALVPEGSQVLTNELGTAPGLILRCEPNPFRPHGKSSWIVMLPGPPRELRPLFTAAVLPFLATHAPLNQPHACLTLRSTGLGESQVEERVAPLLASFVQDGLELGYCARPGEVDIRLVARGPGAPALVEEASRIALQELASHVYGRNDDELEHVVVSLLRNTQRTLAVAESCTGGLLGHRVTAVPGASAVFLGGWIAYSNDLKQSELGVAPALLAEHGAVSEPVARAMAEGARARSGADYALAITGIAGPDGGTPQKPVGTVYIALATPTGTQVISPRNAWDRATFKQVTTQQALDLLRRSLLPPSA